MTSENAGHGQRIIFDVYGTLLDVASPVRRLAHEIGPKADHLADLWRDRQLQLAWLSTFVGRHRSFWSITEHALAVAMHLLEIKGEDGLEEALLDAYRAPDRYPDTEAVLVELKRQGARLAVLSNANVGMLIPALRQAGLDRLFDRILSVDAVEAFKPDARAYAFGERAFGGPAGQVWFVSSNDWDVCGGQTHGFRAIWIDRASLQDVVENELQVERIGKIKDLIGLMRDTTRPH